MQKMCGEMRMANAVAVSAGNPVNVRAAIGGQKMELLNSRSRHLNSHLHVSTTGEMGRGLKIGEGWPLMVWDLRGQLGGGTKVWRRCRLRNITLQNVGEVCAEYWVGESWWGSVKWKNWMGL